MKGLFLIVIFINCLFANNQKINRELKLYNSFKNFHNKIETYKYITDKNLSNKIALEHIRKDNILYYIESLNMYNIQREISILYLNQFTQQNSSNNLENIFLNNETKFKNIIITPLDLVYYFINSMLLIASDENLDQTSFVKTFYNASINFKNDQHIKKYKEEINLAKVYFEKNSSLNRKILTYEKYKNNIKSLISYILAKLLQIKINKANN